MHLFWAASYMKQMCGVSDAMHSIQKPKQKNKIKIIVLTNAKRVSGFHSILFGF